MTFEEKKKYVAEFDWLTLDDNSRENIQKVIIEALDNRLNFFNTYKQTNERVDNNEVNSGNTSIS